MSPPEVPMTEPSSTRRAPMDDEISLWEILAVLLRRRGTIVLATLVVGGVAASYAQLRPLQYTTSASFRPQGAEASSSQLAALASQFGVNVGAGGGEEASPAFYAELLTSREILSHVAALDFDVDEVGPARLKDLLEIDEPTEAIRDEETIDWLRDEAVSVSTGRETGTVTLSVSTEWPEVSVAIADEMLAEVSRFNMDTRHSQAAAERSFIEGRVAAAEGELEEAEDSLRVFLEQNRQIDTSPLLQLRRAVLQREVTQATTVLSTLAQSLVQAEIAEVRDTPVITVLQEPFLPPDHDPRGRVLLTLIGLVLGGLLGILLAFVVEAFRSPDDGDPGRADFRESWDALVGSIPLVGRR